MPLMFLFCCLETSNSLHCLAMFQNSSMSLECNEPMDLSSLCTKFSQESGSVADGSTAGYAPQKKRVQHKGLNRPNRRLDFVWPWRVSSGPRYVLPIC